MSVSAIPKESSGSIFGLSWRALSEVTGVSARSVCCLSEASFRRDSERRKRSSEAGSALNFWLLFFQEKSDRNSGYSDGFKQNEVLWNASASKSFLKGNQATLRFKIYDILKQRSNISRSVTASYTQDSEYNTLGSYFMVHFIYRFSIFKGGASMNDVSGPGGRGPRHGGPMGPPPGGRF